MVGLRQFHATPAVFEIVVVKVPPFADSVSEGDVRYDKYCYTNKSFLIY